MRGTRKYTAQSNKFMIERNRRNKSKRNQFYFTFMIISEKFPFAARGLRTWYMSYNKFGFFPSLIPYTCAVVFSRSSSLLLLYYILFHFIFAGQSCPHARHIKRVIYVMRAIRAKEINRGTKKFFLHM